VGITVFDRRGRITYANQLVHDLAKSLGIPRLAGCSYNDPTWKLLTEDGEPLPDEAPPFIKTYALPPKMLRFAVDTFRFDRKVEPFLTVARAELEGLPDARTKALGEAEPLQAVERNCELAQQVAYFNIVVPRMGIVFVRMLEPSSARRVWTSRRST
jgi:hypothetical protein